MEMKSIVIIFPYFGTLPPQYGMWRASALRNPTIDFMFFTDAPVKPAENIIVHQMSFPDFCRIVQKAFESTNSYFMERIHGYDLVYTFTRFSQ